MMKPQNNVTIKKRKRYSEESLKKALSAIKNGMPKKQAAKEFQVPRATLQFRLNNPNHNPLPGPSPVLNDEEEAEIINWLTACYKKGFPKRKEDVLHSVAEFIKKSGRPNPFKNNIPGEKWFQLFLRRHPDISIRTPEAVTSASAAVSENDVKGWFQDIETYFKRNDLFDVLLDPRRIFNGDETNFVLCPKTGVVLAPRGAKNVYEVDNAQAKTSLTVMFTFAANGETTPPMVIFPYKRLPKEIASKVPLDWGIGLSDNGWMKTEIFSQYIEKVLHPHLVKNQVPFPIILFVDGHKTHVTYAVSELCSTLEIVLIALYPNCTRLLQPADVSAFRPLKAGWQKTVLEWRRQNPAQGLTKTDFVPLLKETIDKCVKRETIINGFRTTGLHPWNPEAVDYSKCLGKSLNSSKPVNTEKNERVMTKQDFVNIVGKNTIESIMNNSEMTPNNTILKNICNFFHDTLDQPVDLTYRQAEQQNRTSNEKTDKQLNEKNTSNDLPIPDILDIAGMDMILLDDFHTINFPPSQMDEEIVCTNFDFANDNQFAENANKISDEDSQIIDCVQVSHTVQIHTSSEATSSRNDKDPIKEIVRPTNIYPLQSEQDKIEILTVENNPKFTTPIKANLHKVKLNDLLVFPKTPQRKGVRNTKKTSFVITSGEFKEEERKKIIERKEKEEGIKKRKEEREQKKLEAQIKQAAKKKLSDTTNNVKKILFSQNFSNLNVDISLKQVKKAKLDKIEDKEVDTKSNLENKLLSEESLPNTEDEVADKEDMKTRKKFSIAEIEKMMID